MHCSLSHDDVTVVMTKQLGLHVRQVITHLHGGHRRRRRHQSATSSNGLQIITLGWLAAGCFYLTAYSPFDVCILARCLPTLAAAFSLVRNGIAPLAAHAYYGEDTGGGRADNALRSSSVRGLCERRQKRLIAPIDM